MFALGTMLPILNDFVPSGYVASDVSGGSIALAYDGPLLAGFVAFVSRGRARFHRPLRSTRRGLSALLTSHWPLLLGAPLTVCAAVLLTARAFPTDWVTWQLLMVDFAVLVACASLGVLLAWALPSVIAIPLSVVPCFLWINYLPATSSRLLHNMSPTVDGFAQSNQPATSCIVAVTILAGAVIAGAAGCVSRQTWDRTPPIAALPLALLVPALAVAASAGSLLLAPSPLNLLAAEPRTTPLSCSSSEKVEVCLWPEGSARADEIAAAARAMNTRLGAWRLPRIVSIGQGGLRDNALDVESSPHIGRIGLRLSIARGYLRQRIGCQDDGGRAVMERVALLTLASGVPESILAGKVPRTTLDTVTEILRHDLPAKIGRWYAKGLSDIRCTPRR